MGNVLYFGCQFIFEISNVVEQQRVEHTASFSLIFNVELTVLHIE